MKYLLTIIFISLPGFCFSQCDADWEWDTTFSKIVKCGKCRIYESLDTTNKFDILNEKEISILTNYFNTICDQIDCCEIKKTTFVFRKVNGAYYIDAQDKGKINIIITTADIKVFRIAHFQMEVFKVNDQGILINGDTAFLPVGSELIILPITALANIDKATIVSFQDNPSERIFLDKDKRNTIQATIRVAQTNRLVPSYSYKAPKE